MPWFHIKSAKPSPHESLAIVCTGKWYSNKNIGELVDVDPYNFPYEHASEAQVKRALKNKSKNTVLVKFNSGTLRGEKTAAKRLKNRLLFFGISELKRLPYYPEKWVTKPSDMR